MRHGVAALAVGIALSLTIGARAAAAQAADGEALFRQYCRSCHGATGTPNPRMVSVYPKLKTLSDSTLMAGLSVEAIVNVLKKGQGDMKPFAEKLTADQMTAVAQFVKSLPSAAHKS